MSKTITSPVKRFGGTVVLAEPLTYPQVIAFDKALSDARELGEKADYREINHLMEPGIMACVEEWHLEGMPREAGKLPCTTSRSAAQLVSWLIHEIVTLYKEADEIPNG